MSLSGKVALVTGAAQGLGRAFSEVLLRRGANVCVADVNVQAGEITVSDFQGQFSKGRAMFVRCDVTKETDIKATFQAVKTRYGRLDLVVNNAGIADEENWDKMIDINLKGVVLGTQYAVNAMRKDKGGHGGLIVNISSAAGLMPVYITPVYCASKYGVVGYTNSWAENPYLKTMGLSFACVCPTFADTDIIKGIEDSGKALYKQDGTQLLSTVGVMPVSQVSDAFEQLLDTPNNNGAVVMVSNRDGIRIKLRKTSRM